jgi:hypothetical protein
MKTLLAKAKATLQPKSAPKAKEFNLKLGDVNLSLSDAQCGIGILGGIGTGKSVAAEVPILSQILQQLNSKDESSPFAKCGGLIIDVTGNIYTAIIEELVLAGRSIEDLIVLDPSSNLFQYNPIDPHQTTEENAEKLARVQKLLGSGSGGENAYWDQTSEATLKTFLHLLHVQKRAPLGIDDLMRVIKNDELATALCDEVEQILEQKKKNSTITADDYLIYTDAVSQCRNAWIQLNQNTKSTLKTTFCILFGSITSNPKYTEIFCNDTNFCFKDIANKGKIILFRADQFDKETGRLIGTSLKLDFQTWQKRRNGSCAERYGLNTTRTNIFFCDAYPEFATCGNYGDEQFYGICRSTRTISVITSQSYNSLATSIKNKEKIDTLLQNIATWIFFRTTDQDTMELGAQLAKQLLTKDDFCKLATITTERCKTGPWYSEVFIHTAEKCYKTNLTHQYYKEKEKVQEKEEQLNALLHDRAAQIKASKDYTTPKDSTHTWKLEEQLLTMLYATNQLRTESLLAAKETFGNYTHSTTCYHQSLKQITEVSSPLRTLNQPFFLHGVFPNTKESKENFLEKIKTKETHSEAEIYFQTLASIIWINTLTNAKPRNLKSETLEKNITMWIGERPIHSLSGYTKAQTKLLTKLKNKVNEIHNLPQQDKYSEEEIMEFGAQVFKTHAACTA